MDVIVDVVRIAGLLAVPGSALAAVVVATRGRSRGFLIALQRCPSGGVDLTLTKIGSEASLLLRDLEVVFTRRDGSAERRIAGDRVMTTAAPAVALPIGSEEWILGFETLTVEARCRRARRIDVVEALLLADEMGADA
jgi:hypothetical protein